MTIPLALFDAMVRCDGEALVLHVTDKPYVVTPTGDVNIANQTLTRGELSGLLARLLPDDALETLEEAGAVRYKLPWLPELSGEHFTIVAARDRHDLWAEIRREHVPDVDAVPVSLFPAFGASQAPPVQQGLDDTFAVPSAAQLWLASEAVTPYRHAA